MKDGENERRSSKKYLSPIFNYNSLNQKTIQTWTRIHVTFNIAFIEYRSNCFHQFGPFPMPPDLLPSVDRKISLCKSILDVLKRRHTERKEYLFCDRIGQFTTLFWNFWTWCFKFDSVDPSALWSKKKHRKNSHIIIHFSTSKGLSERTSEQTDKRVAQYLRLLIQTRVVCCARGQSYLPVIFVIAIVTIGWYRMGSEYWVAVLWQC